MVSVLKNLFRKDHVEGMTLGEVTDLLAWLRLPTSMIFTPVNLEKEKEKFFASDSYNPQFKYHIVPNENNKILDILSKVEQIVDVDPQISQFYIELIKSKIQADQLMQAAGDNSKITKISIDRFGFPSEKLFRNATRVLRGKVDNYNLIDHKKSYEGSWLHFDEVKAAFDAAFEELGLPEWTLGKSKNIKKNGIKVGIKSNEIFADEDIRRKPLKLRKAIVHELTHIIRSHNGMKTGFDALSGPTLSSYLDIEEGLAGYNEELFGLMSQKDLRNRALKTWAIYIGKDMSFRELYNACLAIVPKGMAWSFTYSVKRGLGDTSKPGIYARDIAYFRGFRRVRRKIAEDKSLYEKLYAGKIDFSQVKWVEDGIIKAPKIILDKKVLEKIFKKVGI